MRYIQNSIWTRHIHSPLYRLRWSPDAWKTTARQAHYQPFNLFFFFLWVINKTYFISFFKCCRVLERMAFSDTKLRMHYTHARLETITFFLRRMTFSFIVLHKYCWYINSSNAETRVSNWYLMFRYDRTIKKYKLYTQHTLSNVWIVLLYDAASLLYSKIIKPSTQALSSRNYIFSNKYKLIINNLVLCK